MAHVRAAVPHWPRYCGWISMSCREYSIWSICTRIDRGDVLLLATTIQPQLFGPRNKLNEDMCKTQLELFSMCFSQFLCELWKWRKLRKRNRSFWHTNSVLEIATTESSSELSPIMYCFWEREHASVNFPCSVASSPHYSDSNISSTHTTKYFSFSRVQLWSPWLNSYYDGCVQVLG